tara:strand:- start:505 stop:717 length:213 start_codon:yes stop_codon:yes gene_type:complete
MAENKEKITIDGVDFKLSELSEECLNEIQSLKFTEAQLARLSNELAVTETALNAYRLAIREKLPSSEPKH